jgi:hypothetical protein
VQIVLTTYEIVLSEYQALTNYAKKKAGKVRAPNDALHRLQFHRLVLGEIVNCSLAHKSDMEYTVL